MSIRVVRVGAPRVPYTYGGDNSAYEALSAKLRLAPPRSAPRTSRTASRC